MQKSLVLISYLLFISGNANGANKKRGISYYNTRDDKLYDSNSQSYYHQSNAVGSYHKNYTESQNEVKVLPEFSARTKIVGHDEVSQYDSLINLMRNIPAAAGVLGQGLIWSRELATASGLVIVIPILLPILCLLATGALFVPDWTNPKNVLYSDEWNLGGLKRMDDLWNKVGS